MNGISTVLAQVRAITPSSQRRIDTVSAQNVATDMPMTWPVENRLLSQVPGSWLMPRPPRTSISAVEVTPSLNSAVNAASSTPPRPSRDLSSTLPVSPAKPSSVFCPGGGAPSLQPALQPTKQQPGRVPRHTARPHADEARSAHP